MSSRLYFRPTGLPLVWVLLATPAAPAPSAGDPAVIEGVLSGPSNDAPERIARRVLRQGPGALAAGATSALKIESVRRFEGGSTVRLGQRHLGLRVVGRGVGIRIDDLDRVRWMTSHLTAVPRDFSTTPRLDALEAWEVLRNLRPEIDADRPNDAWLPVPARSWSRAAS